MVIDREVLPPSPPRKGGAAGWIVLRVALAAGILALLIHQVGVGSITAHLGEVQPAWIVLALTLTLCANLVRAWNWRYLVHAVQGGRQWPTFGKTCYCFFAGGFMGTMVPSSLGTDAIRSLLATRIFGGKLSRHAASTVMLNILVFFSGAALGLLAIAFLDRDYWKLDVVRTAAVLFVGLVSGVATAYLLLLHKRSWALRLFRWMPVWSFRVRRPLRRFMDSLLVFEQTHVSFLPLLATVLIAQLIVVTVFAAVATAIHVQIPFAVWMVIVPLVSLGGMIPASMSGFGADQAILIYLLAPFAVSASHAFTISAFVAFTGLFIHCTVGAFAFLAGRIILDNVAAPAPATPVA